VGTILRSVENDPLVREKADESFVNRSCLVHADQPTPDPGLVADHHEPHVRGGQAPQGRRRALDQADQFRIARKPDVLDQSSVAIQERGRLECAHEP
jgi:hypothetical protein